ncbi:acyltransferase family protein [Anaeromicropila populeti]|uniref:Membrane-bound acyltransferase YfiQ, involved in biofilm formation n=1 Tax=Anaeromicropila populeti TaxID=37658 RepID=A0A1I6IB45_9FIRM|nr:acyltransferase [Anaeromicropila populeti]SFR63600.1 Membrane-bound acyltransferase YfiQ, involved in biofilm formation [Anaeromicropila populeti]
MFIYYIILGLLLLVGIQFFGVHGWNEEYLSNENGKGIKGFFALVIMLHHLSQAVEHPGSLKYMLEIGVLCVSIFFFYSGYGLIKSYNTKENYLKGFLVHRLSVVLIPFFVINIIYILLGVELGTKFSGMQLLKAVSGISQINGNAWYVVAITIFYLVFYVLFRFIKNKKIAFTGMFLFLCVYITGCLLKKHGYEWFQGEWWYNTAMIFFVGMLYANFEEKCLAFFKKTYWIALPVSIILFGLLFYRTHYMLNTYSYWAQYINPGTTGYKESWMCLSWQLPAEIVFVIMCILILMKVKFSNKALKFIGTISFELYLVHDVFIQFLHSDDVMVKNDVVYVAFVFLCSIVLALGVWWTIAACKRSVNKLFAKN